MKNDTCLFCRIASHEIPAHIVLENERALAFLDIHPKAPGHTMVISKYHSATTGELPEAEIAALFLLVKDAASRLTKRLHADGLTIGINEGRAGGQEVDHVHVHLMPRFSGDGGGSIQSVVDNPPKEALDAIRDTIKE